MAKKPEAKSSQLAGRTYNPSDYEREDILSNGLATTHEQSSDTFTEGTIDGKIERENGQSEDLPRKGFE